MDIVKMIKNLCTPAYVYLIISLISTVILMIQNGGNDTKFCLGSFSCQVGSMSLFFLAQAIYTAIWVFILNWVCKSGYKDASWALVVLPYLLFFVALGVLVYNSKPNKKKEGFGFGKSKDDSKTSDSSDSKKTVLTGDALTKATTACQNAKSETECNKTEYCGYDSTQGVCSLGTAYKKAPGGI